MQANCSLPSSPSRLSFASYVQVRGSIPVHWSQETSVTVPKPPIILHKADPSYAATKLHFLDLYRRYGEPILVLDLVKQQEKRRRESLIGREFFNAIEVINAEMPRELRIKYCGLDFSHLSSAPKERLNESTHKYFSDIGVAGADAFDISLSSVEDFEHLKASAESNLTEESSGLNILEELDLFSHFALDQTGFFSTYAFECDYS